MEDFTEIATLAWAIESANASHDAESAHETALKTARFLDQELGLETHHLRRMLVALAEVIR